MLKDTKSLGNNKAPACESRGFVRKKQKVCILTHLPLKIKLDKAQSKLRIEVTDTGCGIPPEEREEIFLCLSV